jgi:hypothetical protein
LQFVPQALAQRLQGGLVFSGEEDVPREEAVPQGVVMDGGLPLGRLRPGVPLRALRRLAWACFSLVIDLTFL